MSDLLSQAEHGPDSQVILAGVNLSQDKLWEIQRQVDKQTRALERCDIIQKSLLHSRAVLFDSLDAAMRFSNDYAPEHLILHLEAAESVVEKVENAGSVFVGKWAPERYVYCCIAAILPSVCLLYSCGDYASGTNHTLPTYGFAKMYSGVSTSTFVKSITAQSLTRDGLVGIGQAVMDLARIEGLDGHGNAVAVRLRDILSQREC